MDVNTLLSSAEKIMVPIFILFFIFFIIKILNLFTAKTKNEHTKMILLKIEEFALAAVKEVEQTLVPIYTANGQILSCENANKLKEAALDRVTGFLGEDGKKEAQNILQFGEEQLKTFLNTQIEKGVFDIKK